MPSCNHAQSNVLVRDTIKAARDDAGAEDNTTYKNGDVKYCPGCDKFYVKASSRPRNKR